MLSVNSVNNSPSFKQISIVRVPKKAFQNPEKITKCSLEFGDALDKLSGNKNSLINDVLSAFLGKTKDVKTVHNLEGHLGVRFTDTPLLEDYHTFSVATGEEKDQITSMFSLENILKSMEELKQQDAKEYFAGKVREFFANKNLPEFKIENLEGLTEIKSKLGL